MNYKKALEALQIEISHRDKQTLCEIKDVLAELLEQIKEQEALSRQEQTLSRHSAGKPITDGRNLYDIILDACITRKGIRTKRNHLFRYEFSKDDYNKFKQISHACKEEARAILADLTAIIAEYQADRKSANRNIAKYILVCCNTGMFGYRKDAYQAFITLSKLRKPARGFTSLSRYEPYLPPWRIFNEAIPNFPPEETYNRNLRKVKNEQGQE